MLAVDTVGMMVRDAKLTARHQSLKQTSPRLPVLSQSWRHRQLRPLEPTLEWFLQQALRRATTFRVGFGFRTKRRHPNWALIFIRFCFQRMLIMRGMMVGTMGTNGWRMTSRAGHTAKCRYRGKMEVREGFEGSHSKWSGIEAECWGREGEPQKARRGSSTPRSLSLPLPPTVRGPLIPSQFPRALALPQRVRFLRISLQHTGG
jgi:hypothetical protein